MIDEKISRYLKCVTLSVSSCNESFGLWGATVSLLSAGQDEEVELIEVLL